MKITTHRRPGILRAVALGVILFLLALFVFVVSLRLVLIGRQNRAYSEHAQADDSLREALRKKYQINPYGAICGETIYNIANGFQFTVPEGMKLDLSGLQKGHLFTIGLIDYNEKIQFEITTFDRDTLPENHTLEKYHYGVTQALGIKRAEFTTSGSLELGESLSNSCVECSEEGHDVAWTSLQSDVSLFSVVSSYPDSSRHLASSKNQAVLAAIQPIDFVAAYECLSDQFDQFTKSIELEEEEESPEVRTLGGGRFLVNREDGYVLLLHSEAKVIFRDDREPKIHLISGHMVRVFTSDKRGADGQIVDLHKKIGDELIGGHFEVERTSRKPFDFTVSICPNCLSDGSTLIWASRQSTNRSFSILMTYDNLTQKEASMRILLLLHSLIPLE